MESGLVPNSSPGTSRGHSFPISYEDLQKHFDQPLADVARKFDVCTTFFKVASSLSASHSLLAAVSLHSLPFLNVLAAHLHHVLQGSICVSQNSLTLLHSNVVTDPYWHIA